MKKHTETEDRNIDLLESFRDEISKAKYPFLLTDVLERTVMRPAKRFYISSRRAMEIINEIKTGRDLYMHHTKIRMMNEIIKRLDERVKLSDKPIQYLLEEILDEPAPEFYLMPTSAKVILCKEMKRQRLIQQDQIRQRNERIERKRKMLHKY